MEENKPKKKRIIFRLLKRVKLRTLFLLAITLVSNSFAWLIYSTKVSNSMVARVKSWNVSFEVGTGEEIEDFIELNVSTLYPGMDDYEVSLRVSNSGETNARITYEVINAEILGNDLMTLGKTSSQILDMLRVEYPFSINFSVSNEIISSEGGEELVSIEVTWPYESGDDAKDTLWGEMAYAFHEQNPNTPSIDLVVKLTAYQVIN